MKNFLLSFFYVTLVYISQGQNVGVGTNTPQEKLDVNGNTRIGGYLRAQSISLHATTGFIPIDCAILDIQSTSQGILISRMTQAQRDAIVSPAWGLLIFQYDNNPGFYYNKGNGTPDWVKVGAENTNKGFVSFTTPGEQTYTVPSGVSSFEFEAVSSGGGGGGGQIYSSGFCGYGGGGGGGGSFSGLLKVNPGDVIAVSIGNPGIGGLTQSNPNHGDPGKDAENLLMKVNGVIVLQLAGGSGGMGGVSDGTNNTVMGINGGVGAIGNSYMASYITPYNSAGGSGGVQGVSGATNQPSIVWGLGGAVRAYLLYSFLDSSGKPAQGQGGRGGNNLISGGSGVTGYLKLKF